MIQTPLALAFTIPAALAVGTQDGARSISDPAVGLARAADANGDAELTAEEWVAFVDSLGADADGVVDRARVKLRILRLDADADGVLTALDIELALDATDADGDGWPDAGFLTLMLPELADADQDGSVSTSERADFVARAGVGGPIAESVTLDWLRRSEAIPPADRNALTAGVILVGMNTALDSDASGRVTLDDLNALHRALDGNGDGRIDARELEAGSPAAGGGSFNAANWAVTDAMRERPPLMPWQRSLEDALALSKLTGKPMLLCVNMDGENASESLAWGRYRDREFAALADGFICLIASPDRHNPRERDDRGLRIPDPRLGRVVDSEHIDVEPLLFERYFDGNRVAPRHVGVSPEGEILFDLYLLQDLSIVDERLRKFGKPDAADQDGLAPIGWEALLASTDARRRAELEWRFVEAEEPDRALLASLALSELRATQHPELVRLALRDPSSAVRREGFWTLLQHAERAPVDQLPVACALFGDDPDLLAALVGAARRMAAGAATQRARDDAGFYARAFERLHSPSAVIDVERWKLALENAPAGLEPEPELTPEMLDQVGARLDELSARLKETPGDLELLVELATERALFARVLLATGGDPRFAFDDVAMACADVLERAPDDARALGLQAWASYMASDTEAAAALAARALPWLLEEAPSKLAADVLNLFANLRTAELYAAIAAGKAWAPELVPDALAACEVLVAHPASTEANWRSYLDLLGALQAFGVQADVVWRALETSPTSSTLHAYLRMQILRDEGARALEEAYGEDPLFAARAEHGPALDWFHGLATFQAAEQDVLNQDLEAALGAYARCIERFDASVAAEPSYASSAAHYQAFALAGSARVLLDLGRPADAAPLLLSALGKAPASAALPDGLGNAPQDTGRELRRALVRAGDRERAEEIDEALRATESEPQGEEEPASD